MTRVEEGQLVTHELPIFASTQHHILHNHRLRHNEHVIRIYVVLNPLTLVGGLA